MQVIQLGLRVFQLFMTILIMALDGNAISLAVGGNPAILNYIIFISVFSMLSLFYLIPASIKEGLGHPMIATVLDGLNVLFFFCGAVALAAYLQVHWCFDDSYVTSNFVLAGSYDPTRRCQESQANDAFMWFTFAAYVATLALSAMGMGGSSSMRRGGMGGIRRGPPTMSQV